MRTRAWFLIASFVLAVVLSGISCYDDDYWDDDDYCHYDQNGYWHCHDDDDCCYNGHAQTDGEVVVLVTDQPAGEVSAFHVTITEVVFFEMDHGPVTVYRSETGRRLDLLSLRGSRATRRHDLLAVRGIPTGVYGSIRLTLRDPAVVLASGDVLEGPRIDLVGKGRIDVGLDEHVLLGPDETVRVILDIDVEAAIGSGIGSAIRPGAPPAQGKVRPVVLVEALYGDEEEVPPRIDVEGVLRERDSESDLFHLELPDDRGGLPVLLLEDSEILDRTFRPAPSTALTAGSQVIARGVVGPAGELEIERIAVDAGPRRALLPGEREPEPEPPAARTEGTVSRVAPADRTLEVDVGGRRRTIAVAPETEILFVEVAEDGLSQTAIPLREVEIGANVIVHGVDGSRARLVIVTGD